MPTAKSIIPASLRPVSAICCMCSLRAPYSAFLGLSDLWPNEDVSGGDARPRILGEQLGEGDGFWSVDEMGSMGDDADELLGGVLAAQMLHVERAVSLG